MRTANLSHEDLSRMEESIKESSSFTDFTKDKDFSAIKWFHDNGVPQVIKI